MFKLLHSNSLCRIVAWVECHRTSLMRNQHWPSNAAYPGGTFSSQVKLQWHIHSLLYQSGSSSQSSRLSQSPSDDYHVCRMPKLIRRSKSVSTTNKQLFKMVGTEIHPIERINSLQLSPVQIMVCGLFNQATICANAHLLSIRPLATHFSEIWMEMHTFSVTKTHLEISSENVPVLFRLWCDNDVEVTNLVKL